MGIYKAPVVKNRYRKIVNHFHNKPKSFANEGKNNTPEMTTTLNSSINLKKAQNSNNFNQTSRTLHTQVETVSSREDEKDELNQRNDIASHKNMNLLASNDQSDMFGQPSVTPDIIYRHKSKAQREQSYKQYYDQK